MKKENPGVAWFRSALRAVWIATVVAFGLSALVASCSKPLAREANLPRPVSVTAS